MAINTPETVHKQYNEKKTKKEIVKGLYSIIKKTKKGSKNWADINTENYLKKKKTVFKILILKFV